MTSSELLGCFVSVRAKPVYLNASIAWLFMLGAFCFALGTTPAYVGAVGKLVDSTTFFVGSIFFTSAAFCQLVQAQSRGMTDVDEERQHARADLLLRAWRPRDKNWMAAATQFLGTLCFNVSTFAATAHNLSAREADKYVWQPDFYGSILFLVASGYAISAQGVGFSRSRLRASAFWIMWLNMLGSVAFMISAVASFVSPTTGAEIHFRLANSGTFLGAVCFLVGAALMLPAWRAAVRSMSSSAQDPNGTSV